MRQLGIFEGAWDIWIYPLQSDGALTHKLLQWKKVHHAGIKIYTDLVLDKADQITIMTKATIFTLQDVQTYFQPSPQRCTELHRQQSYRTYQRI